MKLTYTCPDCDSRRTEPKVERLDRFRCPCGHDRPVRKEAVEGGTLRACPWCATPELYAQKDFPQRLGLAIIAVGFLISTIFYALYMPLLSLSVLLLSAVLDMVLYRVVPDVLTCYRCESQLRDLSAADVEGRGPFDLAIGERFRQERLRIEQLKRQRATSSESATAG